MNIKLIQGMTLGVFTIALCCLASSIYADTAADSQSARAKFVAQPAIDKGAVPFDFQNVQINSGPFKRAMEMDIQYLLRLEPDRLLAWFRKEAGLDPKGEAYGGWEQQEIAGHSLGHYLSACSIAYRGTGDKRLLGRVDYIVDELAQCQEANGTGYVAAIPGGKQVFAEIRRGEISSAGFDLNGCWVPWYTLHKQLSGLRDAYLYCNNEKALTVMKRLADWAIDVTKYLDAEQWQRMLACEHGGMNEVLADLYALTGREKYLELAKKFYHKQILDPLAQERDILAGNHANTQIPKLMGCSRIYELTGKQRFGKASKFFWDTVIENHTYVTGGNSDGEYFGPPGKLNDRLSERTTETCNVYNMLKLTKSLFSRDPSPRYAGYYERALYNHILSAQNPETGMVLYFQPLKSGSRKEFMTPFNSFTCCSGSGMENHVRYNEFIYAHDDNTLYVNLFIPSTIEWQEKGVKLVQDTRFPESNKVRLTVKSEKPVELALKIRHPFWADDKISVKVNRNVSAISKDPGSYISLSNKFSNNDVITFELPMRLRTESMPDNPNRIAVFYGPILLAGVLGTAEEEPATPVLVTEDKPAAEWVKPAANAPLTFKTSGVGRPNDVTLKPLYTIYDKRYAVYWDVFTTEEWKARQAALRAEQQRLKELEAQTVDLFKIGEMQPERDHNLQGENTGAGEFKGRKWRHAVNGGWFNFDMKVLPGVPMELVVTYWGGETGDREFDILVNGRKIATQRLRMNKPGEFFDVSYPLPLELTKDKTNVNVNFQAHPGKTAGGVFGVRMLKAPNTSR